MDPLSIIQLIAEYGKAIYEVSEKEPDYLAEARTGNWGKKLPAAPTDNDLLYELDKQKTNLENDLLQSYIAILRAKLPAKPTAENLPFSYEQNVHEPEEVEARIKVFVAKLSTFLLFPRTIHVVFLETQTDPVKYVTFDDLFHIQINSSLVGWNPVGRAVIVRCLVQFYLTRHDISLPDSGKNEWLTDTALVYLGFGFLQLEGYLQNARKENTALPHRALGHLTRDSIFRGIIETALARRQQPYHVMEQFASGNRKWARRRLLKLIHDFEEHKKRAEESQSKSFESNQS